MKSMLFKMIGLAVVAAALALFGGYGIGYDAKAQAATAPQGLQFQGLQLNGMPRGLQFSGVRSPTGFALDGRPGVSHHRGLQPRWPGAW